MLAEFRASQKPLLNVHAVQIAQNACSAVVSQKEFFQLSQSLENALGDPSLWLKLVSYAACARSILHDLEAGSFSQSMLISSCSAGRGQLIQEGGSFNGRHTRR